MEKTVPEGYMQDAMGRLVPLEMVRDVDQLRDETVREVVMMAEAAHAAIRKAKVAMMGSIQAFVELALERYQTRVGGAKGNVTLTSYDGLQRVQINVSERMEFAEGIKAAESLIQECLQEWSADSRPEIRVLIQDAFRADSDGSLQTARVLSLLRLDIDDPRWRRAMDAIKESLTTVGSKSYLRIQTRARSDGPWVTIPLDAAQV